MLRTIVLIAAALLAGSSVAHAQRGTLAILIPGSGGIQPNDFLIRSRFAADVAKATTSHPKP
jgi:hypothetical protein